MNKIITQNHGMGCGVACVAVITKLSYKAALQLFAKPKNAWTIGYRPKDLVEALAKAEIAYSFKYLKNQDDPLLKSLGTISFHPSLRKIPTRALSSQSEGRMDEPLSQFPRDRSCKRSDSSQIACRS